MRIFISLFLLALFSSQSIAGTALLTWDNPTRYVDGTDIPAGQLASTRAEWGTCVDGSFSKVG